MIPLPKRPKIQEQDSNTTIFALEGLYPGYGLTLGNALRRILLSSLGGAAITSMKIEGVTHEFTTIPGVVEDGILVMLNLKKVRFQMTGDGPVKTTLKVKGDKEAKASDFNLPSQLEVVNGDQKIATLTDKKASLEIEVEVNNGLGYEPAERRGSSSEEGVIDLDALYSPVTRVAFKVEDMRVGKRTDFDRLLLEVETDGRMTPREVYVQAVEILQNQVDMLGFEKEVEPKKEKKAKKEKAPKKAEKKSSADLTLKDLGLPARIITILGESKIKSVAGLIARTEENIVGLDGVGPKSVEEIKKALKKKKLSLK